MAKTLVRDLKVGDVIMPPAREVSLWMRRTLQERNLPESALHLTITKITDGAPDKRGPWLVVVCDQTPEWRQGATYPFTFKARPDTPWQMGVY